MQKWKTLARHPLIQPDGGRFLAVENHTVELPDGTLIEEWPWLITPDYINVVVETVDERFLCFRQVKYAVDGVSLAIVGGYIEADEKPLPAAQRELLEETGYVALSWTALGRYVVDGNRGCGHANLFLARGARWQQPIDADDLEEQEMLFLNKAELIAALQNGEFKVLAWATAVALALPHLHAA